MTRRSRRAPLAAALMILVGLTGCSTDSASRDAQTGSENGYVGSDQQLTQVAPADRDTAPEISGPSLTSDKIIDSDDYADRVIVYNVWGSWCAPCRKEAPDLQQASDKTSDVAQFIGINSRDTGKAQPQAFVRANNITYPSIYDPDGSQVVKFDKLPPSAIPSTLIVDKKGRVAVRVLGSITTETLVDMIDDVAAGK